MEQAVWHENNGWKQGSPYDFFADYLRKGRVFCVVGAGGKTSTVEYLSRRLAAEGRRTALITTTHMRCPEVLCRTFSDCVAAWNHGEYAFCGVPEGTKLSAPEPEVLEDILAHAEYVIAEADGAKMRSLKAPAAHEPVILPQADTVIGVVGLSVLGGTVEDVCFRTEQVCRVLGCDLSHRITCDDIVTLLLSENGTRKGVGDRTYIVVLNQCDGELHRADAEYIINELERRGQYANVATSYRGRLSCVIL